MKEIHNVDSRTTGNGVEDCVPNQHIISFHEEIGKNRQPQYEASRMSHGKTIILLVQKFRLLRLCNHLR